MSITVGRKRRGRQPKIAHKSAYHNDAACLPTVKLNDLLELCSSNVIPRVYHPYYQSLTCERISEGRNAEQDDEGSLSC